MRALLMIAVIAVGASGLGAQPARPPGTARTDLLGAQPARPPGTARTDLLGAQPARPPGTARTDLQRHDLSIPGREVVQLRVDFAPGASFPRHTHPGEEIIYVI